MPSVEDQSYLEADIFCDVLTKPSQVVALRKREC
jgi:hypothetical protein